MPLVRKDRHRGIAAGVAAVGLTLVLLLSGCSLLPGADAEGERAKTQSDIESFISRVKTEVDLPYQLDPLTVLDKIEVEEMKIHYFYTVTDMKWTDDLEDFIKDLGKENVCGDLALKGFAKRGVTMTYEYYFVDSDKTFGVNMAKVDCSK